MNGLRMNVWVSCTDRGVLEVKQRESPSPPGLIATTLMFLNLGSLEYVLVTEHLT